MQRDRWLALLLRSEHADIESSNRQGRDLCDVRICDTRLYPVAEAVLYVQTAWVAIVPVSLLRQLVQLLLLKVSLPLACIGVTTKTTVVASTTAVGISRWCMRQQGC